jgi:hypothetical protein
MGFFFSNFVISKICQIFPKKIRKFGRIYTRESTLFPKLLADFRQFAKKKKILEKNTLTQIPHFLQKEKNSPKWK